MYTAITLVTSHILYPYNTGINIIILYKLDKSSKKSLAGDRVEINSFCSLIRVRKSAVADFLFVETKDYYILKEFIPPNRCPPITLSRCEPGSSRDIS